MTYKTRSLTSKIDKLLNIFPAVVIIGPRQCGKTSLAQGLRPKWKYFDLESAKTLDLVSRDISFFFKENDKDLIIDEAQRVPQIFDELRGSIDSDRKSNGRFIITGSSSPELLKNISNSGSSNLMVGDRPRQR